MHFIVKRKIMTDRTEKKVEIIKVGPLGVRENVGEFIGRIGAKALGFMLILLVGSVVIIIRNGISIRSSLFFVGPILSAAGLIAFNRFVIEFAATGVSKRGWIPWLNTMGAWLPYIYGCYLFFYEGLWQIFVLFRSFSIIHLFLAMFCMAVGFILVNAIHRVTEFMAGLRDGRILIRTENGDVVPPPL